LISDSPQFDGSPYGFSGTITTDGSIGSFTDVDFITDWSITLETPGDDGILTQVLSRVDGPFGNFESVHGGDGDFVVTATDISIASSGTSLPTRLRLGTIPGDLGDTFIDWSSPGWAGFFLKGGIKIHDFDSTPPNSDFHVFGSPLSVPVATGGIAIPEPSSFLALSWGALGLPYVLRNRRQARRPRAQS
jgi:hypothetical protein